MLFKIIYVNSSKMWKIWLWEMVLLSISLFFSFLLKLDSTWVCDISLENMSFLTYGSSAVECEHFIQGREDTLAFEVQIC